MIFPYLGFTVTYNNSYWAALNHNIQKVHRWWSMVGKVVLKTKEMVRVKIILYKVVVQLVLLYGSESWVVTMEIIKVLEVFHHWLKRRILGMTAQSTTKGDWECPPVDEALETAGIRPIK